MKHASSRAPDLLHGPVFSNMTRFFLPIMLGSLLQQLYSMVDAVVLGRLVGKTALAAVGGASGQIINLVVGFFVGLASGACVVVSQHYGAGEDGAVRRAVHTAILFSVVIGAVMTALGIGLAFGLVQGFLIAKLEIQPFIVTLAGMFFARGMTAVISTQQVSITSSSLMTELSMMNLFSYIAYSFLHKQSNQNIFHILIQLFPNPYNNLHLL